MQDGQSIISGWSDGKIRAFGPQSGKLLYTIHDAHQGAVTAISGTPDSTRIISGGEEGMVRMWAIHHNSQVMEASMKVLLLKLLTAKARTAQEGQLSKGYKASMHVKGARAAFSLCNGTPCRHTRHVPGNGMKSQVQFIQMRQCFWCCKLITAKTPSAKNMSIMMHAAKTTTSRKWVVVPASSLGGALGHHNDSRERKSERHCWQGQQKHCGCVSHAWDTMRLVL